MKQFDIRALLHKVTHLIRPRPNRHAVGVGGFAFLVRWRYITLPLALLFAPTFIRLFPSGITEAVAVAMAARWLIPQWRKAAVAILKEERKLAADVRSNHRRLRNWNALMGRVFDDAMLYKTREVVDRRGRRTRSEMGGMETEKEYPVVVEHHENSTGHHLKVRMVAGQDQTEWEAAADRIKHAVAQALPEVRTVAVETVEAGYITLHLYTTDDPAATLAAEVMAGGHPLLDIINTNTYYDTALLGVDEEGNAVVFDAKTAPHALLAGMTQSGKSTLLKTIVANYGLHPGWVLLGSDVKQTELPSLRQFFAAMATTAGETLRLLETVKDGIDETNRWLAERGLTELPDNAKRHLIVIEELTYLRENLGDDWEEQDKLDRLIAQIAATGRSAGFHLLLTTQRPDADALKAAAKANVAVRIVGRLPDRGSAAIALGELPETGGGRYDPTTFPARPGVFVKVGDNQPVRFQSWPLDRTELERLIAERRRRETVWAHWFGVEAEAERIIGPEGITDEQIEAWLGK